MAGATVTELIAAARALIGTTENIFKIAFPHPTVSEVLKEATEDAFGLSIRQKDFVLEKTHKKIFPGIFQN